MAALPSSTNHHGLLNPFPSTTSTATILALSQSLEDCDIYCRAPTQDRSTKKHNGPRCGRKKVHDGAKFQHLKTIEDLVKDELCDQHKGMKDRFMHVIVSQLLSEGKLRISAPSTASEQTPPQAAAISTQTSPNYLFGQRKPQSDMHPRASFSIKQEQAQDRTFGLENLSIGCSPQRAASGPRPPRFTPPQEQPMLSPMFTAPPVRAAIDSDEVINACRAALMTAQSRVMASPSRPVEPNAAKAIMMRTLAKEMNHLVDLMARSGEELQDGERDNPTQRFVRGQVTDNDPNPREIAENNFNEREVAVSRNDVVVETEKSTNKRETSIEEDDWFNDLI